MTESSEPAEIDRESLPGAIENIRTLLVAHVSSDWHKLCVTGRMTDQQASHECNYRLRGGEQSVPLAVSDVELLNAAVAELFDRLREELSLSCRTVSLEYDADERYAVQVSTS